MVSELLPNRFNPLAFWPSFNTFICTRSWHEWVSVVLTSSCALPIVYGLIWYCSIQLQRALQISLYVVFNHPGQLWIFYWTYVTCKWDFEKTKFPTYSPFVYWKQHTKLAFYCLAFHLHQNSGMIPSRNRSRGFNLCLNWTSGPLCTLC